jgi:hypothetical protein
LSPLARPSEDLTHFPAFALRAGEILFRIRRADRSPWWFGSTGAGRFDLSPPRGTCYLAEDPLGAFVEVFREAHLVPEEAVRRRVQSHLGLPRPLRLADCAALALTGAWAAAFATAGFDGIRYLLSHDPAQRLVGYALFGDAGEAHDAETWPPGEAREIGVEVLARARRQFGFLIVPAP